MALQPNFLIVGAAKSGTTSLTRYLADHPQVFMPAWKEPGYFSPAQPGRPSSRRDYLALFAEAGPARAIGESSTAYLYDEGAANRIWNELGLLKIIIILRHPADMAFSLWQHNRRAGLESREFKLAFKDSAPPDGHRAELASTTQFLYRDRGMYCEQVRRYLEIFGRRGVRVYVFEEFFGNPQKWYVDVCRFLEISESYLPREFGRHNEGSRAKSETLSLLLKRRNNLRKAVRVVTPKDLRVKLMRKLQELNRSRDKDMLHPEVRRRLASEYSRDIARLEVLLKRSLDVWRA